MPGKSPNNKTAIQSTIQSAHRSSAASGSHTTCTSASSTNANSTTARTNGTTASAATTAAAPIAICTNGNSATSAAAPAQVGRVENTELRIIIIDENWSQYCYRIKINTPFGKLINRFCQQVRKIDHKSVLFWYHGRLVEDDDTPKTLNIKDGEVILAHYIK